MTDTAEITRNFALYFALPLWSCMGFADYLCHRATQIERTSGLKESLIHSLMLIEMSLPVTLCLYLEVTALVLVFLIAIFFIHEVTMMWDIAFAQDKRHISLLEMHIHSYLAVLPFMLGSFVICLNWPQFLALLGFGTEPADFSLRWKQPQLPVLYHIALSGLVILLLVIPYAEEAWRCHRAQRLPRLHPVVPQPANT